MSVTDKTYCQHYPDGLPYCAKCEARRIERLEQLQAKLSEARAEIENKQYTITCASEENQQLKESLSEARAEIERLKLVSQNQETVIAAQRRSAKAKNELIEQMREAFERINSAAWRIKLAQGNAACSCESLNAADIIAWSSEHRKAALSAAERGECL